MNQNRVSRTNIQVEFPLSGGAPEKALRGEIEILETSTGHDVATIRYTGYIKNLAQRFRTGAPVRISWGNRYGRSEFVGYIHHLRPEFDSKIIRTEMVCIGASFSFLKPQQRTWQDVSADLVVRQIAAENGFQAITEPHPRMYQTLHQNGISDWALMKSLSKDSGYPINCEGTTLYFVSRDSYTNFYKPLAQGFKYTSGSRASYTTTDVFSFRPLIGDYVPEIGVSNLGRIVSAVDPATGEPLVFTKTLDTAAAKRAVFTAPETRVANTPSEARAILDGRLEANRFAYRATVRMVGSPAVAPERQIYLKDIPHPYGGYWTVITVKHILKSSAQYTMEVDLGSDSLSGDTNYPNQDLSEDKKFSPVIRRSSELIDNPLYTRKSGSSMRTIQDVDGYTGKALEYAQWYADQMAS